MTFEFMTKRLAIQNIFKSVVPPRVPILIMASQLFKLIELLKIQKTKYLKKKSGFYLK